MNDRTGASVTGCSSFAQHACTFCSRCSKESSDMGLPCRELLSIRSAKSSSTRAERSSYSCWKTRTASGNSKPCNWRRYFEDAIRITKSVRSCGCHCRMWSRKRRPCGREEPNSKRTPVARDRVVGILLGLLMMWLAYDRLWSSPAGVEMKRSFVSALRLLAQFAREPVSEDIRVATERNYALREIINAQFDKVRSLADGRMFTPAMSFEDGNSRCVT
jgi:hypothetical protein